MAILTANNLFSLIISLSFVTKLTISQKTCEPCDTSKCPQAVQCSMGTVKDRCGCCDVCGLEQGHRCNTHEELAEMVLGKSDRKWYGGCGKDLECKSRTDVDEEFLGKENVCFCIKPGRFCATDGQTYSTCEMQAVTAKSNGAITVASYVDCKTEPKVVAASPSQKVFDGEKTTFWCEIRGYPMPTVSWYFTPSGFSSDTYHLLPGDSPDISVSLRGAAPNGRVVSHLQIRKFGIKQEGTYQCYVENDFGSARHSISAVYGGAPSVNNISFSDEM